MVFLHDICLDVFIKDRSTIFMFITLSTIVCMIMYGCQTCQKMAAFLVPMIWLPLSKIFTPWCSFLLMPIFYILVDLRVGLLVKIYHTKLTLRA